MNSQLGRVLLVDDDQKIRDFYSAVFQRDKIATKSCENLQEMREALQQNSYDAVYLDLNLGKEYGLDGLPYVLKNAPYTKVFILTSQTEVEKAMECLERGAHWYFTKGSDPTEILNKSKEFFSNEETGNTEVGKDESWKKPVIGNSEAILETITTVEKLQSVDSTVLILGESGTGKEVIARAIHMSSNRKSNRFEAINCGAIPENLLESELFGHKKGAFTDAKQDRQGIFETCSDGTLLLDEIGDMPLTLQTKLLRVLQEKEITPVGSTKSIKINTRVIAATHRDIQDEVKCGRFREDLFYRLSVIVVRLPALRHRKTDIPMLVEHFVHGFDKRFNKKTALPSAQTISQLQTYDWPGNIRELQNAVERGVVLSNDGNLETSFMFSHLRKTQSNLTEESNQEFSSSEIYALPLTEAKQLFEKTYLEKTLTDCKGNVAELARRSGRYRADLYRMMEKYEIDVETFRKESTV